MRCRIDSVITLTDVNAFRKKHEEYFGNNPSLFAPFPEEVRVIFSNRKKRKSMLKRRIEAIEASRRKRKPRLKTTDTQEKAKAFQRSILLANRYNIFASPDTGRGYGGVPVPLTLFFVHCLDRCEIRWPDSVHGFERLRDLDSFDVSDIRTIHEPFIDRLPIKASLLKGIRDTLASAMNDLDQIDWSSIREEEWVGANPGVAALFDAVMGAFTSVSGGDRYYRVYVSRGFSKLSTSATTAKQATGPADKYVRKTFSRILWRFFEAIRVRRSFMEEARLTVLAAKRPKGAGNPPATVAHDALGHPKYGRFAFMRRSASNGMVLLPMLPELKRYDQYLTKLREAI